MYVSDTVYYLISGLCLAIRFISFIGFCVWCGIAFSDTKHPHLIADKTGKKICPALEALDRAKKAERLAALNQVKVVADTGLPPLPSQPLKKPTEEVIEQLERLVKLKESGALDDEEFQIQKNQIINKT